MKEQLMEISKELNRSIIEILSSVDSDQAPELIEPLIVLVQKLSYLAGTVSGGEGNGS